MGQLLLPLIQFFLVDLLGRDCSWFHCPCVRPRQVLLENSSSFCAGSSFAGLLLFFPVEQPLEAQGSLRCDRQGQQTPRARERRSARCPPADRARRSGGRPSRRLDIASRHELGLPTINAPQRSVRQVSIDRSRLSGSTLRASAMTVFRSTVRLWRTLFAAWRLLPPNQPLIADG